MVDDDISLEEGLAKLKAFESGSTTAPPAPSSQTITPSQTAAPKPAEDATDYENMPLSEAAMRGVKAFPSSAAGAFKGLYHAVTNPMETLGALGDIGSGLASKAAGAVGMQQNAEEKARREALVNAIGEHYAQTYGTGAGFKKALATDPASIGMDVSALAPGVGPAARAAGLTGKALSLTQGAAKVASLADPIQASLAVAKGLKNVGTGIADYGMKGSQSAFSGVSPAFLDLAREAGAHPDPKIRQDFLNLATKKTDPNIIPETAMAAAKEIKDSSVQEYLRAKGNLGPEKLPMDKILGALSEIEQHLNFAGSKTRYAKDKAYLDSVRAQITETMQSTDPLARTAIDLDNLKQSIDSVIREAGGGTPIGGKINQINKAIKETIASNDPYYARMLAGYESMKDQLHQLAGALQVKNKPLMSNILRNLSRAQKGGKGASELAILADTEAGKSLPYMIAGHEIAEAMPEGWRGTLGGFGVAGAVMNPALIPHMAGAAVMSSPRLAGMTNYALGRASKIASPLTGAMGAATSAPATTGLSRIGQAEEDLQQPTEGRIERASGGRTTGGHQHLVDRLMRLSERAKKDVNATTEPLLDAPDEVIATALHQANKAI